MRSKPMLILLITAAVLATAPEASRKLHDLRATAKCWTQMKLWNGFWTVYAQENDRGESASGAVAGSRQASANDFHWQGQIAPGHAIEIKGINGNVRAEAASGRQVEVVASKHGHRSDPNQVRVQALEHSDGVTICALYPSDDPNRPNICQPGPASRMSVHNNDVRVNFTVRVPSGVRFVGRTVNGNVETTPIESDAEAYTVNGNVHINTTGYAQARTVNGGITASLGNANWTKTIEFKTVNGDVALDLPALTSTQITADTLNGDISTEFPMTVLGRFSRRHVNGTIGGGGRELLLKTINGNIRVRRAS